MRLPWPVLLAQVNRDLKVVESNTFKKNSAEKIFFPSSLFCETAKIETIPNTFKKQKSENICNNHIELTQNSCTLPFMFDLWSFVIKRAIFFPILFRKYFSTENYVCFNFFSYPRAAKELKRLSADLQIACSLFRKKVYNYIKPEQWNSSVIEIMNKYNNKNV